MTQRTNRMIALLLVLALAISACGPQTTASPRQPPAIAATARPTAVPRPSPTTEQCHPAAEISLNDVGDVLCVYGTVRRAHNTAEASFVDLDAEFYLLSYDVDLSSIPAGVCIAIQDEIKALGSHPVIVVAKARPPIGCDSGQPLALEHFGGGAAVIGPTATATLRPAPTQPPPPPPPTNAPPRYRIGASCADGWSSQATGSGACSHHGGVSCWRYSDGTCTKP